MKRLIALCVLGLGDAFARPAAEQLGPKQDDIGHLALAVDASHVYWTNHSAETVRKQAK